MATGPGRLQAVAQLTRAPLFAVTFMFVLLGVAGSSGEVPASDLALILVASIGFHVAVYVVNDIVDLPIDRTEPRRATSPLVLGTVTPGRMAVVAAAAAVVGVGTAAVVAWSAGVAMACATGLLIVYDVWGKRCALPPLTDLVQGLGWAALLASGSLAGGGTTATTAWLGAYVVVAILLVNGVHGAVRDLANDQRYGARTTARFLGASVDASGAFHLPVRLWVYGVVLHVVDVALLAVPLTTDESSRSVELAVVVAGGVIGLVALGRGLHRAGDRRVALGAGFAYIIVMLAVPAALVAESLDGAVLVAMVVLFVGPWAGSTFVRSTLSTGRSRLPDAVAQ